MKSTSLEIQKTKGIAHLRHISQQVIIFQKLKTESKALKHNNQLNEERTGHLFSMFFFVKNKNPLSNHLTVNKRRLILILNVLEANRAKQRYIF